MTKTAVLFLIAIFSFDVVHALEPYNGTCKKVKSPGGSGASYNNQVIQQARAVPKGGGYDASDAAVDSFSKTIQVRDGRINVPSCAVPFCSGGTFCVFMKVVAKEQAAGRLDLSSEAAEALKASPKSEQPDGAGVWGRWNANGEGAAVLFKELGLGRNFSKVSEARPGDFGELFWNDNIGGDKDSGHAVIFDSVRDCRTSKDARSAVSRSVCFWSSNSTNDAEVPGDKKAPGGWGLKCVPQEKIFRTTFSRLESLTNLNRVPSVMGKGSDRYVQKDLANLVDKKISTAEADNLIYGNESSSPGNQVQSRTVGP